MTPTEPTPVEHADTQPIPTIPPAQEPRVETQPIVLPTTPEAPAAAEGQNPLLLGPEARAAAQARPDRGSVDYRPVQFGGPYVPSVIPEQIPPLAGTGPTSTTAEGSGVDQITVQAAQEVGGTAELSPNTPNDSTAVASPEQNL